MKFQTLARLAGAILVAAGLAGCVDMTEDIYLTSTTTAKVNMTQTMGAEIYGMIKAADAGGGSDKPFCKGAGETLVENADSSGTCTSVSEGPFADLTYGSDDTANKPTFTDNGDGTVKIAIKTKGMIGDLGKGGDEQTQAMMKQMFDGRYLTIRFGGAQIVDSNMEAAPDSANYVEIKIPFLSLIDGTADLPEELYATVRP